VSVRSTRPFGAARILEGRTPADAAATAPALFSICARAQGAAAEAALAAASGDATTPAAAARRESAVRLETIQEYLWRLLIDWPKAMGREPLVAPVAAARQRIATLLAQAPADAAWRASVRDGLATVLGDVAAMHVYGVPPAAWLALLDVAALDAWARAGRTLPAQLLGALDAMAPGLGRSDVPLMAEPKPGVLVATVVPALRSDPAFGRAPDWAGTPVETGALARTRAHPLIAALLARDGNAVRTRMAARLVELAQLVAALAEPGGESGTGATDDVRAGDSPAHPGTSPGRPWVVGLPLAPGEGLGAVETARGLLIHRARVAAGRVTGYQIVAPTEWNFHPRGALVRGLDGLDAPDEDALVQRARLVVQALDPCVACSVEVGHA
jgi:hypothetical protein